MISISLPLCNCCHHTLFCLLCTLPARLLGLLIALTPFRASRGICSTTR